MDILMYTLKSLAYSLVEPYWAIQLAILAFILYRKNEKTATIQKLVMGRSIDKAFDLTISQIVIGIFAGIAASLIMSYLGVVFDETSMMDIVFLASILFLFFNPRFVSFAYCGSFLALTSLILSYVALYTGNSGWDIMKLDVPAVMTMVAVLVFMEGVLVMIDGKRGSMPVFTEKEGRVIGGFVLQRYWIAPVALFFMLHDSSLLNLTQAAQMPQWWPVLKSSIPADILKNAVLMLIPFFGIIGYNTITFTKSVGKKAMESGALRAGYGIILFGLAQLSYVSIYLQALVPVLAVAAYLGIVFSQRKRELEGQPKYVSSDQGMMILQVLPESPGDEMGMKSGDTIMKINDSVIGSEEGLLNVLRESSNFIWISLKREDGTLEQISYNKVLSEKNLGLLLVPNGMPQEGMTIKFDQNSIKDVINKIKKRDKDN